MSGPAPGAADQGVWSAEASLLARPFRTYRALAERRSERTWRDLGRGVLMQGVMLGAFVSLTSAGRLVASHMLLTALFWGFLPLLQIAAVAVAIRVAAPRERVVAAASLYLEGMGPYYVFFLALSAVCLFATDVYRVMTALLGAGVLPLYLLATIGWGAALTWAFFREGLALPRAKAWRGAAALYAVLLGVILGWYIATNQIPPQVLGTGP